MDDGPTRESARKDNNRSTACGLNTTFARYRAADSLGFIPGIGGAAAATVSGYAVARVGTPAD